MTSTLFGQTSSIIDSLKVELNKNQVDTIKAQVLNDLAYYYLYQDIDTSLIYGKQAELFATKINYAKIKAKANLYIGNAFLFTNQYDSAKYYYEKSYKIFDSEGLDKSAVYSSLGMFYKSTGDYQKAIEFYYNGLKYDDETANEYGKFIKLLNLGNVYYILDDFTKSIEIQEQAVAISKSSNSENIKFALGTILNNIGGNYMKLKNFDKSLDYYNQSLVVNLKNENSKEIARNYHNLGAVYEKKNELGKSINFLKKALEIRVKFSDKDELIETHMQLGTSYGKMIQKEISKNHFDKALRFANEINDLSLIAEIHLAMSDTYLLQNNPKQSLVSFKNHTQFRDSVLQADHLKSISEIEIKYETEKKDKAIVAQQLAIKQNENDIESKNTQLYFIAGFALFFLVAMILTYLIFKQKQKRKNQEIITLKREHQISALESLMQGEEQERLRISKELHDGVNGDLSAIKFKLSSLLEMNNKVIKEAVEMIDNSCKQVRAISHNLVPPSLENFNLVEASEEYCFNLNEIHEQEITFQQLGESFSIPKNAEINIFRIIQELVSNSIKHADADEINVQISCRENLISLSEEDNGVGFDPKNVQSDGIGLKNIQSRIDYLNANMDVLSNKDGTSYTIEIDINKLNDNN